MGSTDTAQEREKSPRYLCRAPAEHLWEFVENYDPAVASVEQDVDLFRKLRPPTKGGGSRGSP